jgi:amino acid transporter
MDSLGVHRPRNVDWKRAAALLYGDWGTSKAYVIGLAFVAAAYSAFPIIVAVCVLTAVVGYNYIIICKHYPDGGGVYSAARSQSRLMAAIGALLLVANFTVTAAMSGWSAMTYFGVPEKWVPLATIGTVVAVGVINTFGPKHSGSLAIVLAIPMVIVVVAIIVLSAPYLTWSTLQPSTQGFGHDWVAFTGVILALSGVEAVANLTGVMKLDPGSTLEKPSVAKTARKAIAPVALEVVLGTVLLGWAMLSLPDYLELELQHRWEDMLRFLAEEYGAMSFGAGFGNYFGLFVGAVVGLLLLSAVNTAVAALIGLVYMMARDGEMPRQFAKLNSNGVPKWPLAISVLLPILVVMVSPSLQSLAGLYAIGVVGAIAVNLGACTLNKEIHIATGNRVIMGLTFLVLVAVELTVAWTQQNALFFAVCVLGVGLGLRGWAQRKAGLRTVTLREEVAAAVTPDTSGEFRLNLQPGQSLLVAARGVNPVLRFALEEARLRQATLYVLYIKEVAVAMPGVVAGAERPRWQDDTVARDIMYRMLARGKENDVPVVPVYMVSENPAGTILDLAATLGVDILVLGTPHRSAVARLLKGNLVTEVAHNLPENIQLLIYG